MPTLINATAERYLMAFMGINFVNRTPSVTPIKVTTAKAIIEPANTARGLLVMLVIMIAAIAKFREKY